MQAATGASVAFGLTFDGELDEDLGTLELKITNMRVAVRRNIGLTQVDLGQLLRVAAAAVEDFEMQPDVSLTV
jgi:hypothetical protein